MSKKCLHPGCNKQPYYNNEGESKVMYCVAHKMERMIDVRSKRCLNPGCKKQPNYNNEGETKGMYCLGHKMDGMVNVQKCNKK